MSIDPGDSPRNAGPHPGAFPGRGAPVNRSPQANEEAQAIINAISSFLPGATLSMTLAPPTRSDADAALYKLALEKDRMIVSASSPEHGSATEEVAIEFDGGDVEIGFNSRYVLDITDQIDGDIAKFILADAGSPTIITEVNDASALYVLMPMRV